MRITETELILPALLFISENDGITTSELKEKLTELFQPTGEDAEILAGRIDTKFSQKVRNLKSHDTLERHGFAIYDPGEDPSSGGTWRITEHGRSFLERNIENIDALISARLNYSEALDTIIKESDQGRNIHVIDENLVINEGSRQNRSSSSYERSDRLRRAAIEHYRNEDGHIRCCICGFDFLETYGGRGRDFIIIHHEKPLYETEGVERTAFLEQAVQDVKPVCPNCHSMIHRNMNETLSIEEMRELINP